MANSNVYLTGKPDPNRPDMAKITMIFYKPGFNRVPKVLKVTGPYKNWDERTRRFRPKTQDAAANNAALASQISRYQALASTWDEQGVRWTPKDLSHYFDKPREMVLRETVIPTVEQVYLAWISDKRSNQKLKNGHEVPSDSYADAGMSRMKQCARFVREKYDRSFSNLQFTDITEKFLLDYVFYIETEGAKKGNKGGLREKLHSLYQVVKKAEKKNIPGADLDVFQCTVEKFRGEEPIPRTISMKLLMAMENLDRSLLSDEESYHLDLFLFCFYCGGMAPIDAAYLTWPCIDMKRRKITYERIKTPKKGRPPFVPRAEAIARKYSADCYRDFVLPMFEARHTTHAKKKNRMSYLCSEVNETLRRIVKLLGSDEEITWYSARGTYITMMCEKGYRPEIIAEHSGNSVRTIFKFYFKNVHESDIIADLCAEFAA